MDPNDAISRAIYKFNEQLRADLKKLLEQKHLYQTLSINVADIESETVSIAYPDKRKYAEDTFRAYAAEPWTLKQPVNPSAPPIGPLPSGKKAPQLDFPTIKLFCETCDRLEPYNLVTSEDLAGKISSPVNLKAKGTLQVFAVGYVCQGCKSAPEFFMIRREGTKLSVVGRTPMAHVDVPPFIPASHRKLYVGAVIAYQARQVLPALFMLRTFIEQFANAQVNTPGLRADEILNRYMAALPAPVRDHFPSPRQTYARLSDAIHTAREDEPLYDQALKEINEHFDARRLYKV
jgi:hypothetical protein